MKNKTTAALFALFLGGLGAHLFYLGRTKSGITYLVLTLISVPLMPFMGIGFLTLGLVGLLSFMDFIYIISKNDLKFNDEYNNGIQGGISTADELQKLHDLKVAGILTQEEFDNKKSKLL